MKITGTTASTTTPRSDWNQTDPRKSDYIKNKPTLLQPDWSQTDSTMLDYIKNKPDILQSDWSQMDHTKQDYIKGKPDLEEKLPRVLVPGTDYGTSVPTESAYGKLFFVEDDTADYVLAQGISNGVTYRKWESGFAEFWVVLKYSEGDNSVSRVTEWRVQLPFPLQRSYGVGYHMTPTAFGNVSSITLFPQPPAPANNIDYLWVDVSYPDEFSGTVYMYCVGRWKE